MAIYKSSYTGPQIDEGIKNANTAVQQEGAFNEDEIIIGYNQGKVIGSGVDISSLVTTEYIDDSLVDYATKVYVDEKQTKYIKIDDVMPTATSGTLTQEQVQTLLSHQSNYIQFFNENFYPQDVETDLGYIIYSHVGVHEGKTKIKTISLTISTGGWVLNEVPLVSAPITIVDTLPEANEENFEKGKIYTTGELLQYISKSISDGEINLANTLPQSLYRTSAVAVGNDIYIFGGNSGAAGGVNTIYKYSTTTNALTTMSSTFPQVLYYSSAAAVGTDIYIFGGSSGGVSYSKAIYKYSTTTGEVYTMSSTLPKTLYATSAAAVGTDIYIFGGEAASKVNTIYKYSTTTGVLTTMSSTLPQSLSGTSAAAVGTDIYIFGGYGSNVVNTIYKYSTTTGVLTTMSSTLPKTLYATSAAAVGNDIYIFGGYSDNSQKSQNIYKYSTTTGEVYTMSSTLPQALSDTSAAAVGNDIYIFGGYGSNVVNTIYDFSLGYVYTFKTIATQ